MKFTDPNLLFWLWAALPVGLLLVRAILRRKRIMARFADPAMDSLFPGFDPGRRWIKAGLVVLALVLAVFALAGPTMGFRWEKATARGVDIMIALDCSRSMLAQDIHPSRLERAKREIIDLTRMLKSDRAGLVAFSGQAILQCPLTLDHGAFQIFLKVLTPDYLPVGGTNLAAAIQACLDGFEADADTEKAIILITDGENTAGDVADIAKKAGEDGIRIFSIGVGDPAGAPIPDSGGGFKKDENGNIILSKVDEPTLTELADLTGGRYVRSQAGDMDLDVIYTQNIYSAMERKILEQGRKKVWEQRFQWFLFPCVLLLILELWLPVRRKTAAGALVLAVLMVCGAPEPALAVSGHVQKGIQAYEANEFGKAKTHFIDAQLEKPDDPRLYYNIGAAAYKNGDFDQAAKNFSQAATAKDPELRHKALFNLANTRYRQGKLADAIQGYETIVAEFPNDTQAKENLEFVKQQQEQQQQNQQCENPQDKNQDQQDQQNQSQQNQDQQNSQDQNQQDQDQDGQDQDGQDQNGQDRENQGQQGGQDQQNNNTPSDTEGDGQQQPPPPKPSEEPEQTAGAAGAADDKGAQAEKPGDPGLENRLNRLEDKPGMALMPVPGKQRIQKDW